MPSGRSLAAASFRACSAVAAARTWVRLVAKAKRPWPSSAAPLKPSALAAGRAPPVPAASRAMASRSPAKASRMPRPAAIWGPGWLGGRCTRASSLGPPRPEGWSFVWPVPPNRELVSLLCIWPVSGPIDAIMLAR